MLHRFQLPRRRFRPIQTKISQMRTKTAWMVRYFLWLKLLLFLCLGNDSVPEEPFDDTMSVLNLRAVSGPGGLNVNDFSAVDFQKVDDVGKSLISSFFVLF